MENQIKNVCLSFQCPMQWAYMQPLNDRERFCAQCHLAVTDFTNATEELLEDKLKAAPGRVCGRFNKSQMSADYLKRVATTVAISAAIACTPEPTFESLESITPTDNVVVEDIIVGELEILPDSLIEISFTGMIVTVEDDSVKTNK
ncbi:MAG TPA: hypothetical protein PKJ83_16825 [Cyclobacteriaceae bacterium]|nr:hypothetical protein [Cyclobacteriaceae bacterium]